MKNDPLGVAEGGRRSVPIVVEIMCSASSNHELIKCCTFDPENYPLAIRCCLFYYRDLYHNNYWTVFAMTIVCANDNIQNWIFIAAPSWIQKI